MSTNLIRNADHTRIHLDTSGDDDKEWTFLVYLTTNWTQNFYGETAFFERNSDDTEIVAEVRPRYGRAVIFQGILLWKTLFTLHKFCCAMPRNVKMSFLRRGAQLSKGKYLALEGYLKTL